jgi:hypothetical protein
LDASFQILNDQCFFSHGTIFVIYVVISTDPWRLFGKPFLQKLMGSVMQKSKQGYQKMASERAKAASKAKSQGDRDQLLEMNKRYLELAENEGIVEPTDGATKSRRSPALFK